MPEDDKMLTDTWVVIKFRGQKETSAGIAFPDSSRVPPVDVILTQGIYFKNLKDFTKKYAGQNDLILVIVDEASFKSQGYDQTVFQGFEAVFIDKK